MDDGGPVTFVVYGLPVTQGSHKIIGRPGTAPCLVCGRRESQIIPDRSHALRVWRDAVRLAGSIEWKIRGERPTLKAGVKVAVLFRLPMPKSIPKRDRLTAEPCVQQRDLDKLLRAVFDSLKGVTWVDDGQVTDVRARKEYALEPSQVSAIITVGPSEKARAATARLIG